MPYQTPEGPHAGRSGTRTRSMQTCCPDIFTARSSPLRVPTIAEENISSILKLILYSHTIQLYVYGGIFDNPPGLLSARGTDCFFFFFFCLNVNSGALIPRRSTAHREGRRISFVKGFIIGYLFVVHVFVVYISRRDEGE
jgi:hypothetical protein